MFSIDNIKNLPTSRKIQFFSSVGIACFSIFSLFVPISSLAFATVVGPLLLGIMVPLFTGDIYIDDK